MTNKKTILTAGLLVLLLLVSAASAATLNVGPKEKYKTIQSAVNMAHNGDTIKVASGTYKEYIKIDKCDIKILGTKYPKVYGFYYYGGSSSTINGFSIQKYGISASYEGGPSTIIRNNYFYNCGISFTGHLTDGAVIMNNQIIGGTIDLNDCTDQIVTGNTISNSKCGLYLGDMGASPTVTKNTFKNCKNGVYVYSDVYPGQLKKFSGNKYIKNKVNIGWGTAYQF